MNPCEKILKGMNPVIKSFHSDKWMEDNRPVDAESLYLKYLERHPKHISDLLFVMEIRQEGSHAD